MPGYTPMMDQYLEIKNEYKYCLVFFRLGDFYELFFDDAIIASKELDITLTGRDCGMDEKAPMCGVPYHSAENYIAKLIEKGYKVAICEQTENPKTTKTIVKREVVRVITPGTVLDQNFLDSGKNNYIVSIFEHKNSIGISVADITTGEFYTMSVANAYQKVLDELARFTPTEIIATEKFTYAKQVQETFKLKLTLREDFTFKYTISKNKLCSHFNVHNLKGFGIEDDRAAVCSAGGLLYYLLETQKNALSHITSIKLYHKESYMAIDYSSRRNLEICETLREKKKIGSLLWVLDKTKTPPGARMLRKWITEPLMNQQEIEMRLDAVSEFKEESFLRDEIREKLRYINDMERILSRITYGVSSAREFVTLKNSIKILPGIKELLEACNAQLNRYFCSEIDLLEDVHDIIEEAIVENPPANPRESGFVKEGFNSELDNIRKAKSKGSDWILELEAKERTNTGIKNLKVKYNKVFGYYFEVTKAQQKSVPERFIRTQTLANCERYATPELKSIEETILKADEKINTLEQQIFSEIKNKVASEVTRIQTSANIIAAIDALQSLAETADKNNYVRPNINKKGVIEIRDGRHPVVELFAEPQFIPNDAFLNSSTERLITLTGPNMAGKSTYMRQIALISLMAQAGSFVPASSANISITDKIFTRVGASDDLATGQSTFMIEMTEVSNILTNSTPNSLIILDEIGRGTSTYDGLSIAWAVLEYIANEKTIGAKTLFATHYHEMTELEGKVPGVVNYCVQVKESGGNIVFLRKIARGGADKSYGIHVAKLAGLPQAVINRALEIMKSLSEHHINNKKIASIDDVSTNKKEIPIKTHESQLTIRDVLKNI